MISVRWSPLIHPLIPECRDRAINKHEAVFLRLIDKGEFSVDEQGRIWRANGSRADKNGKRYRQVQFRESPKVKWRYVYAYHIVALVYHGDIPPGHEVNHVNGDKQDNRPCNLEIVTKSQMVQAYDEILHHYYTGVLSIPRSEF